MWKDGLCSVQLDDHGLLSYLSHFFLTLSDFPSRKIFPYYTRDILCNRLQIFTFYMSCSKCLASCTQTPSMACIIKPVFFQNFGMQVFLLLLPNLPLNMIQKGSETAEPRGFRIYYLSWDPSDHAKRGFITNLPYKFFSALRIIFEAWLPHLDRKKKMWMFF